MNCPNCGAPAFGKCEYCGTFVLPEFSKDNRVVAIGNNNIINYYETQSCLPAPWPSRAGCSKEFLEWTKTREYQQLQNNTSNLPDWLFPCLLLFFLLPLSIPVICVLLYKHYSKKRVLHNL